MMKYVKKLLPKRLLRLRRIGNVVDAFLDVLYDFGRYVKYSSVFIYDNDEEKLRALITASYHNIEKGLSLPAPRLGFGKTAILNLLHHIDELVALYGARDYLSIPVGVLLEYIGYHKKHKFDVGWLENEVRRLEISLSFHEKCGSGGTVVINRSAVLNDITAGGEKLFLSRSSCRQYSSDDVSDLVIENAVRIAQKSPVVCNRQSGRVYVFRDRSDIDLILEQHGGARGFGDSVPVLFCLTTDLRNFNGSGERAQGLIDGGLFAMSFVYGLHIQGLGSCCLNWSKGRLQDRKMRDLISLPHYETITMFVAAGYLPAELSVAKSIRKPVSDVLKYAKLNT